MSIRISNESISVVARGYTYDPETRVLVWLEMCPAHPKSQGAIWASLVNGCEEWLKLDDGENERYVQVRGLGSRYHRITADSPLLALAGRRHKSPKLLRLVAPSATKAENGKQFYILEWPGMSLGTTLAAMLEASTSTPVRLAWGDYLLHEAVKDEYAVPLVCGGKAPLGYRIDLAPWNDMISQGVRSGRIGLNGN
ncbi:MAG: hypothetical protein JW850_04635 [Thermoflexales bacterium]|nr:hypothetical protein [Thermoflexales bacterium]